MPIHKVTFEVPRRPISHADIEFRVQEDGELLGKLLVSKGAVVWRPRNKQKGFRMRWDKFHEMMRTEGRRER